MASNAPLLHVYTRFPRQREKHIKILVTGGAGYIGSHTVRQLSEAGLEAVVYDNLSSGSPDNLIHGEQLVVGDLADTEKLHAVFKAHKIGAVCHFAASTNVAESVFKPLGYYENNAVNTLRLLEACLCHNVDRFVFSSSAAVYGEPGSGSASEETPVIPVNPYGAAKLAGEWMLRDTFRAHRLRYVVLRYFNAAGADPLARMGARNSGGAGLMQICCQAALGLRDGVPVYGTDFPTPDGTAIRDYVHVEDIAKAHLAALAYLERGGPPVTLNVGCGKGTSVQEVIDSVRRVSGVAFPSYAASRRPGEIARLVAEAKRIRKTLEWEPRYPDIEQIAADAFRWEQSLQSSAPS